MISERKKILSYSRSLAQVHFWRGSNQQEIDYVEHLADDIFAYEIKWKEQKSILPSLFHELYPEAKFQELHRGNYFEVMKVL